MLKKRKNNSRQRKKRLKQVVSDLRRRACVTRSGIRGKCRAVKQLIRVSRKKKEKLNLGRRWRYRLSCTNER